MKVSLAKAGLVSLSANRRRLGVPPWWWAAVAILWPHLAAAQGPPINTESAFVTGLNGAAFRTFFFALDWRGLRTDGRRGTDPLDRRMRLRGLWLVFPYELVANRLIVTAMVPYLSKTLEVRMPQAARRHQAVEGFGDLTLAIKLGVWQRDAPGRTTRVALGGSVNLPTGSDHVRDAQGELLPRALQLGTGSPGYAAGAALTHSVGAVGLSGAVSYARSASARGYLPGDVFRYDLAVGYRVLPRTYRVYPSKQINLYAEVNGTWSRGDLLGGRPVADSGGHVLLASPGVQFIPGERWLVELTYQRPIRQRLNGSQLAFQPTLKVGLRWLVF